jgi:thiopurine S-methyltransferase
MVTFSKTYWDTLYRENKTGWDIGYPSPALIEYIDQLKDKSIRILIPGAGNAHEAMVLIEKGFSNTYILDFSDLPIQRFKEKYPQFPVQNILKENFFNHKATYDLILEQTFFSSLHPTQREQYVAKMYDLLSKKGKLAGLLFDRNFGLEIPPFGGSKTEYKQLFGGKFNIHTLETAYNSIKPRLNTELFFIFEKK